jgi:hypothetical protein
MATSGKGFDPLASLFDGPDLSEFTDPGPVRVTEAPESTDPLISVRADAPVGVLRGESPMDAPEPEGLPLAPLGEAPPAPLVAPPAADLPEPVVVPEPAPIAEPAPEPEAELEEMVPPPPPRPQVDKAALAKALARAALAKAGAAPPKKKKAKKKPAPQVESAPPLAPPPPKAKAKKPRVSRLSSLAERAARPRSALDAARAAAEAETEAKVERDAQSARDRAKELSGTVEEILRRQIHGVGRLKVQNAALMDDRVTLKALWRAHRARFASQGNLAEVVATTQVVRAVDAIGPHQLAAAIVLTDTTDYLVWIDLGAQTTIAAFPDARAWYASARK